MNTAISILFYAKRAKATSKGLTPVYLRVTINGQRFEISTKRYVEAEKWSVQASRMKGNSEEARSINTFLDTLRSRAYDIQCQLLQEAKSLTAESFKNKWLGITDRPRMLFEVFSRQNEQMKTLIEVNEFAPATLERYNTSLKHTRDFVRWKYQVPDLDIKSLSFEFISDYEFWLKSVRKCNHNTAIKYISNFRKIVNICRKNGWLTNDPFIGFKMTKKDVIRDFLTEDELRTIAGKVFATERLNQVRDVFLFSCFTGLAYADVKKLKPAEICNGTDGEKWIFMRRKKTDTLSKIPILTTAQEILDQYKEHPQCLNEDRLLPVLSNQKMNSYLKEIADVSGINKNLTFHMARHTFATTITLTNGVPIESISHMLGHKNMRTTQHYAKIIDKKLSTDMLKLKELLIGKNITSK